MAEPDVIYINRLLEILKKELEGFHKRVAEVESIRYLEDRIALPATDKPSGLELRVGLTAELIENVKAALTTNEPVVKVKPLKVGGTAADNATQREKFWTAYLKHISEVSPVLDELVDAEAGLGMGALKVTFCPWSKAERRRRKAESDKDYLARQDALKRLWGPPFRVTNIHPLALFFRPGPGNRLTEVIEHSWKPRRDVYPGLGPESSDEKPDPEMLAAAIGFPTDYVKPMPVGVDQADMVLATEYWRGDLYKIILGSTEVHREPNPAVAYFIATGRSSSSKDPDKFGLSVADILRHTEPHINRTLTRMAEAADLLVRKRLTLEVPEGMTPEIEYDEDNNPVTKTYRFDPEVATALPSGSKVVDPFAGVEAVYAAMPFISMLMQITARHGVSPIFKGQSPGAAGSGYRDTSLYMMALSQFKNLLKSYSSCLTGVVTWLESCLVSHAKQKIWVGSLSLDPSDVSDYPAVLSVEVEPFLPQNVIAEGHFFDYMHKQGHITRRMVLSDGMNIEDPERMELDRMLEDIKELLKPLLYRDVMQRVGLLPDVPPGMEGAEGGPGGGADVENTVRSLTTIRAGDGGGGRGGQQVAGAATGGQPRQAPYEPGSSPPSRGAPTESAGSEGGPPA